MLEGGGGLKKEDISPECIRFLPPELACTSRNDQRAGEEAQDQEQSRGHFEDCGVDGVRGCRFRVYDYQIPAGLNQWDLVPNV